MEDPTLLGIHDQDLSRTDATLGNDIGGVVAVGTDLRRQGDEPIPGGYPARRTQSVAIQQAAGVATIGQDDARRTVPGLHVHGVILVKGLQVRIHALDVLPGRRDQHAQGPG